MKWSELIRELGPLTVLGQLCRMSGDLSPIRDELAAALPLLPTAGDHGEESLRANLESALAAIPEIEAKRRLILVGPELILLEVLWARSSQLEVIVAVDNVLSAEMVARIANNVPAGLDVHVVQLPALPLGLKPAETVLVAAGFDAGCGNVLVPETTRNILNNYSAVYFGETVLLDPIGLTVYGRPESWVTVNRWRTFTRTVSPTTLGRPQDEKPAFEPSSHDLSQYRDLIDAVSRGGSSDGRGEGRSHSSGTQAAPAQEVVR